ncbi:hypothetical protein LSTR_LSTR014972 [Laodelphax striatellus]|uniref:Peptidase metallopeptidase domain-containing protein n=1 Tax=Laodelphax striatellus TaxID=195883 RepID=A0A482XPF0_LAOST|nr:hypothetical protein LSTR_LSTR014972 [Laodelphax striatellus]
MFCCMRRQSVLIFCGSKSDKIRSLKHPMFEKFHDGVDLQTQRLLSLEHGKVRRELHRALDLWAQNSQLTFREVASENADIVINFHRGYHGDGYPFDGQGLILAQAFFPGPGRGGDVHFDEDEVWQVDGDSNQVGGTSLFSVAAHEFGHSLGLSHSSVVGALMYPWYHGLVDSYRLPEDDRHGIQQLYGSKGKLWAKIPVYTPSHDDGYHPRRHHPTSPPLPSSTTTTTSTTTANPRPDEPATCDTTYDAVSVIRSEVFIFKEKYMWRISDKGLMTGYPALITRLWSHLPKDLTHIDAAYERTDKKIVFFIGRHYYVFRGNTLERGYPQPLTSLGLPHSLDKVDSAFVWGHNSKTYIFAGDKYWKLDDEEGRVERDYPRDMSVWKGVGYPVDAVFQWKDGEWGGSEGT